jgi:hypothetical protein
MKIFSVLLMIFLAGCSVNYQDNRNATITTQTTVYESKQAAQKLQSAVNLAIPDIDYDITQINIPKICRLSWMDYSMQKTAIETGFQKTIDQEQGKLFYDTYLQLRQCIKTNTSNI